ncbi:microsomal glutathione S-transferase 1.2 [Gouania willdenowi]|uniref:Microsomal glutathione S-transferase 1 n=1 Tax=Gouania willdenowi TaxID=441366 RepID=A0A8C5E5D4_GOUWI|nr:microsomal glutathione S-transferase 1 [Gouania willdenowi]
MSVLDSEVFQAFSTYAAIVGVKILLMGPLTAYYRFTKGAFANPEDVALKPAEERKKLLVTHPDVERVRRCHQNDLETSVPFLVLGLLFALKEPSLAVALLHFRLFAGSRLVHTVSYVGALPQPCRALSWMVGMGVNFSMAYRLLSSGLML